MKIFRHIPPAGTPISFISLISWLFDIVRGRDRKAELIDSIKSKYGVDHCYLMSSGRAAMALIFKELKRINTDPERCEIIMPSYTCYSVPAAAEIAGLKVRVCDIDPDTLSYDVDLFNSINFSKVLCVVSASLYGNPNDLSLIEEKCKVEGCYFLDDAAQSMNARIDDRWAGTFGDIGIYSLDKGKNITSIQGGIVVSNNHKLAPHIENAIKQLPDVTFKNQISDFIKLIIYSLMLKPYLYWIPANISVLGLGKTIYTTDYLFSQYNWCMSPIAYRMFRDIDKITQKRCDILSKLTTLISNSDSYRLVQQVNNTAETAALRFAFCVKNKQHRDDIINDLVSSGISATGSYPQSIADLEQVQHYLVNKHDVRNAGQYVALHVITLPTISYINSNDIAIIEKILSKYS